MAAKTSWHRYGTKLPHCHPMYTICRLGKPDHRPNPRLWYYNTGLGGKDEVKRVNNQNWSLKTFPTLLRQNSHTDVRIFVCNNNGGGEVRFIPA